MSRERPRCSPADQPPRIFIATVRVESATSAPPETPVLVFTLACGHQETRLRALYPHWQDGEVPPVGWLICQQCSSDISCDT